MIRRMALMAVLGMAAAGCTKENGAEPQVGIEEPLTAYTVRYTVNGVAHTETIVSEQQWADFLQRMMALAEEGYRVTVSRNVNTVRYAMSKKVVTYTTTSKELAYKWMNQMLAEGYEVTIEYGPSTGQYTCTAVNEE